MVGTIPDKDTGEGSKIHFIFVIWTEDRITNTVESTEKVVVKFFFIEFRLGIDIG